MIRHTEILIPGLTSWQIGDFYNHVGQMGCAMYKNILLSYNSSSAVVKNIYMENYTSCPLQDDKMAGLSVINRRYVYLSLYLPSLKSSLLKLIPVFLFSMHSCYGRPQCSCEQLR